jgi:hypothetical protein
VNRRLAVILVTAAGLAATLSIILMRPAAPAPVRAPRAEAEIPAPKPALRNPERPVAVAPAPEIPPPPVEAPPDAATLRIDSDVPGAQVFIDRQFIGAAPVVPENVTPGSHQLNVSAEGFDSVATSIDVVAGQREIVVRLREVRLESSVDVIHRHGVGSCRGRLVATPQGLRYETSNRDDSFAAALLDLETFQVDYLGKNLRVKVPKGRQFNFTDPEGNADRLFVFHRDVEKARERLRKGTRRPRIDRSRRPEGLRLPTVDP